jgi:hypothetical protein
VIRDQRDRALVVGIVRCLRCGGLAPKSLLITIFFLSTPLSRSAKRLSPRNAPITLLPRFLLAVRREARNRVIACGGDKIRSAGDERSANARRIRMRMHLSELRKWTASSFRSHKAFPRRRTPMPAGHLIPEKATTIRPTRDDTPMPAVRDSTGLAKKSPAIPEKSDSERASASFVPSARLLQIV